jgi:hypothetical protein
VLTLSARPRDSVAIAMLEPGAAERGGGRLGRGAASLEFGGDLGGTRTRGLLRFGRRTQRSNNPLGSQRLLLLLALLSAVLAARAAAHVRRSREPFRGRLRRSWTGLGYQRPPNWIMYGLARVGILRPCWNE